ncbi:MAG: hypothetical protein IK066_11690, partial [Kiritimatiellae bacterium]|nr:hypothetical protein [Kiritimatiellia bacterium]
MMFKKIKSGIAPFDNLFQGFYLNRPTLLSGKRKSGASTLALRFLARVLQIGEKILLFTEETPDHVTLEAHGIGADISDALHMEQLCIVPYDRQLPLLPFPEALDELREMIAERHYTFVVLDTAIPWLAAPADRLEERLNAFFELLDETAATAVLVLRHPVSPLAKRLFDEVSQRCAICLNCTQAAGAPRTLEVTKYMGAPPEQCPAVIPLGAGTAEPSPYLSSRQDGMNLRELHKAVTQRIQVDVPSYLASGPLPSSANAAPRGFPPAPAPAAAVPRAHHP